MSDKITVEFERGWLQSIICNKCPAQQCEQKDEDLVKCCVNIEEEYYKIKEQE